MNGKRGGFFASLFDKNSELCGNVRERVHRRFFKLHLLGYGQILNKSERECPLCRSEDSGIWAIQRLEINVVVLWARPYRRNL